MSSSLVLVSPDGHRVSVPDAFIEASSTLTRARFAAEASCAQALDETPVPFPAEDIRLALDAFSGIPADREKGNGFWCWQTFSECRL